MSASHKVQPGESVDDWVARQPLAPLLAAARRRLLGLGLTEVVKWSQPWYTRHGNVAYLSARPDYVTLGVCHGAHLDDPDRILEGTGKDMRHVKIRHADDLERPTVARLLATARAYDDAASP